MRKKQLLPDYIVIECSEDIYLGDDNAQEKAFQTILAGLSSQGGIYIILGPSRTGKGTVFEEVSERAYKDNPNANPVDNSFAGSLGSLPADASIHNIVRLHEDKDLKQLPAVLEEARGFIEQHPNSSVIVDMHIAEPRIPEMMTIAERRILEHEVRFLEMAIAKNPDVAFVRTKNDIGQLQETMWQLYETLSPRYEGVPEAIKEEFFGDIKNKDLDRVFKAMEAGARDRYDHEFDKIRENYREPVLQ